MCLDGTTLCVLGSHPDAIVLRVVRLQADFFLVNFAGDPLGDCFHVDLGCAEGDNRCHFPLGLLGADAGLIGGVQEQLVHFLVPEPDTEFAHSAPQLPHVHFGSTVTQLGTRFG